MQCVSISSVLYVCWYFRDGYRNIKKGDSTASLNMVSTLGSWLGLRLGNFGKLGLCMGEKRIVENKYYLKNSKN